MRHVEDLPLIVTGLVFLFGRLRRFDPGLLGRCRECRATGFEREIVLPEAVGSLLNGVRRSAPGAALAIGLWSNAYAGSGFELRSQSATTLGSAQAGMTAGAEDITTIVLNPAALAFGRGSEIAFGVTGLATSVNFSESSSSTVLGTPIGGNQGGDAGTTKAVPNAYYGTDLSQHLRVGLAIAPRFGLGSYWSGGWVGRYYAVGSELVTVDMIPTLSIRPNETLSLGIGVDVQYARIKTSSAIDFGTIGTVLAGADFGGAPASNDGSVNNSGSGWTAGFDLGLIYEPQPGTRIGVDYHSKLRQSLHGSAQFDSGGRVGTAIAAATGAFIDSDIRADLTMPASAAAGIYNELGGSWAVMFDAKWTQWNSLQSLDVTFSNPAQPPVTTSFAWHNSWFLAIGTRYRINEKWAVRFGAAYDQTPTAEATRSPAIPDSDSRWLAMGLEYCTKCSAKINIAYGHIFASDTGINLQAAGPGNTFHGNLAGTIQHSSVDYLAVQAVYRY
jgi:long-chain fatty acid transport protein